MRTILVTGGMGFIGSHTCVALLQAGYEVIIIDNLSNSKENVLATIANITNKKPLFYRGDVGDKTTLETIFTTHHIDAVLHFAAYKAVGESCTDPWKYYTNNISGLITLTQVMKQHNVVRCIFSSSCTVYDLERCEAPFDESDPTGNCSSPYGTTKYICEGILRDVSLHQGFQVASLRYFNPIGAHPSGLLGEDAAQPPTNLLPIIFQVLQGKREKLQIFGDDYPTVDGTCIRDYIHIQDLAQAHLVALDWLMKQDAPCCEMINVGTGRGTSVRELIAIVEEVTTGTVKYEVVSRRVGDVPIAYALPQKALDLWGRRTHCTVHDAVRDGRHFIETLDS